MSITTREFHRLTCNGCGAAFFDSDDGREWRASPAELMDAAEADGWSIPDHANPPHLCPTCTKRNTTKEAARG